MLSDYPMAARDAFGSLLKAINSSVALVWRTIKDKSGTTDGQSRRHNLPRLGVHDYMLRNVWDVKQTLGILTMCMHCDFEIIRRDYVQHFAHSVWFLYFHSNQFNSPKQVWIDIPQSMTLK